MFPWDSARSTSPAIMDIIIKGFHGLFTVLDVRPDHFIPSMYSCGWYGKFGSTLSNSHALCLSGSLSVTQMNLVSFVLCPLPGQKACGKRIQMLAASLPGLLASCRWHASCFNGQLKGICHSRHISGSCSQHYLP